MGGVRKDEDRHSEDYNGSSSSAPESRLSTAVGDNPTLFVCDDETVAFEQSKSIPDPSATTSIEGLPLKKAIGALGAETHQADILSTASSTLLREAALGKARLMAVFGGQALPWLEELQEIVSISDAARAVVMACSEAISEEVTSESARMLGFYEHGFDVPSWIQGRTVPEGSYQCSAPISYPMILVTQMAEFAAFLEATKLSPAQANYLFRRGGISGHSQGVVAAIAVASASSKASLSSLAAHCARFARLQFWHGARSQQFSLSMAVPPRLSFESHGYGLGNPTPMLAISNLSMSDAETILGVMKAVNASVRPRDRASVSLENGAGNLVLSGSPRTMFEIATALRALQADPASSTNESRVPFSQRKLNFTLRYLRVTVPFHSSTLVAAVEHILDDAARIGFSISPLDLEVAVFSTHDASNLQNLSSSDELLRSIIEMQCCKKLDWSRVMCEASEKSHILDFGPGGINGIGRLCARVVQGRGIRVALASSIKSSHRTPLGDDIDGLEDVLGEDRLPTVPSWANEFGPRLDAHGRISTRFTAAFPGRPPVMVPGMTPCTASHRFVVAVSRAGFHVELAGGGQHHEKMFRDTINQVVALSPAGTGVTVNLLFLNPYLWRFQFPTVLDMRRNGTPIESITIAAGVPSDSIADDIITRCMEVNISKIGFKPATRSAITSVLALASRHPQTTFLLQWTGGQSGGHHSFEDQHESLLDAYADIRHHHNVVLIVGGGVGDGDEAARYLTGSWSLPYARPLMPVDAVLCGTRVMVARECETAPEVKAAIAAVPGVSGHHGESHTDSASEWERSFEDEAGGVITVLSELGEPIHKVANRGTRLWRRLDRDFLSLPPDELVAKLERERADLIASLNADFQKPYFCKRRQADGGEVLDSLELMTYADVFERMVELFAPPNSAGLRVTREGEGWIDETFFSRTRDFAIRITEKFSMIAEGDDSDEGSIHIRKLASVFCLLQRCPYDAIDALETMYPQMLSRLMAPDDVDFFLALCRRVGKPVNFVPVLDANLKFWFKKDSLWFSENLRSVPDRDPERVAILQGPVATKHSRVADEPVYDILNGIVNGIREAVNGLRQVGAIGTQTKNPMKTTSSSNLVSRLPESISICPSSEDDEVVLEFSSSWEPSSESSLQFKRSLPACVGILATAKAVFREERRCIANPFASILCPRSGQRWYINGVLLDNSHQFQRIEGCSTISIRVFDPTSMNSLRLDQQAVASFEMQFRQDDHDDCDESRWIEMTLTLRSPKSGNCCDEPAEGEELPMAILQLNYRIDCIRMLVFEESFSDRCQLVSAFYRSLWLDNYQALFSSSAGVVVLDRDMIQSYRSAIGETSSSLLRNDPHTIAAPLEFGMVLLWPELISVLLNAEVGADLFSLVHLSNDVEMPQSVAPFRVGDRVRCKARLVEVAEDDGVVGRVVGVEAELRSASETDTLLFRVRSRFAIREFCRDHSIDSLHQEQLSSFELDLDLESEENIAILLSKTWHTMDRSVLLTQNQSQRHLKLRFDLRTTSDGISEGNIFIGRNSVSSISSCPNAVKGIRHNAANPALSYLSRHANRLPSPPSEFESPIPLPSATFTMPGSNAMYSAASLDVNPIHSNRYAAELADLPSPIAHGVHVAARARRHLEYAMQSRIVRFNARFERPVQPGSKLKCEHELVALVQGRRVVDVVVRRANDGENKNGEVVLKATAELVDSGNTVVMFTGQGSAHPGMADLSSTAAKRVWQRADAFFMRKYGFSLLNIVNENPRQLRVRLNPEQRRAYAALTVERVQSDGSVERVRVFDQVDDEGRDELVFASPGDGLLFATQFQQPAVLLQEKAAFETLREQGAIPDDLSDSSLLFAGHSLGEYSALACLLRDLDVETLAELVFVRGITMQAAVARDASSRSDFAMVAASPERVSALFPDSGLEYAVDSISYQTQQLLQVVNFNARRKQYVVSGHWSALEVLRCVLNRIHALLKHESYSEGIIDDTVREEIGSVDLNNRPKELARGVATIVLQGIDVPFHSRLLLSGVQSFRCVLQQSFEAVSVDPDVLELRYVPNLIGKPFSSQNTSTCEAIVACTGSSICRELLDTWNEVPRSQRCLLLLIELLAFQFASPVRWIQTQDALITAEVDRVIEFGPSKVLLSLIASSFSTRVACHSLRLLWAGSQDDVRAIRHQENWVIDYVDSADEETAGDVDDDVLVSNNDPSPVPAAERASTPSSNNVATLFRAQNDNSIESSPSSDAFESVRIPFNVLHALRVLVAFKLNMPFDKVSPAETLKALSNGKSALQNEVVGDAAAEFGHEVENASDMSLKDLAQSLTASSLPYVAPGKILKPAINRDVARLLPGDFPLRKLRAHIGTRFAADDSTIESVLTHALIMRPNDRLANASAAQNWVYEVVSSLAKDAGVPLVPVSLSNMNVARNDNCVATIDAKVFDDVREVFRVQNEAFKNFLNESVSIDIEVSDDDETAKLAAEIMETEHGSRYIDGIKPIFEPLLIREYDSSWNWARVDAFELVLETVKSSKEGRRTPDQWKQRLENICNRSTPELLTMLEAMASSPRFANDLVNQLYLAVQNRVECPPRFIEMRHSTQPKTSIAEDGVVTLSSSLRYPGDDNADNDLNASMKSFVAEKLVSVCEDGFVGDKQTCSHGFTAFQEALEQACSGNGLVFEGKVACVTGAGQGSIGMELVRALLRGGCTVVVSTSRPCQQRYRMFQRLYRLDAGKGARLIVVPFNAASTQDVKALVNYFFDGENALGRPDFIVPFAAIPEGGRDIGQIDAQSELAHRAMLTNVIRMLGLFKDRIGQRSISPSLVLLPLSPNHGCIGSDGLYAESKVALETLFSKWSSEGWGSQISLIGASIGWTRGTGLMNANDVIAEAVERDMGVRTFDAFEMALCLAALLSPAVAKVAKSCPLRANLTGGLSNTAPLPLQNLRQDIMDKAALLKAVHRDREADGESGIPPSNANVSEAPPMSISQRADFIVEFPDLPSKNDLASLPKLEGLVDPSRTVVVVGFGEVGPWGSSRTRWQRELREFDASMSPAIAVEMARSMNLIKYDRTKCGWVDTVSGNVIADAGIWTAYGDRIRDGAGIRPIEADRVHGFNPGHKLYLQQVALEADMPEFDVTDREEADFLRKEHGDRLELIAEGDRLRARLRKGAVVYVPKRGVSDRGVAGLLPRGWNLARLYGVDDSLVQGIDMVTQYALAATMEAFGAAGIGDAYELYEYVHVSQVGNMIGGGMGGMHALKEVFQNRMMEAKMSSDTLQETFINSSAAWVNMLLLSSCGSVRTPVAACASAAVSVELAADAIRSGRARVAIAGGTEDICEEGSFEFGKMNATSSSVREQQCGRSPSEQCRPSTSSRSGFMESQGAGVQILMSAELALEMGLPIYAIVAGTTTATDRQGRSVPAPGKGILSSAAESPILLTSPLLDIDFRRSQMQREMKLLNEWRYEQLQQQGTYSDMSFVDMEFDRRHKALLRLFGGEDLFALSKHGEISALRGALTVWGLDVDDIDVVSFHGTGTTANDVNESEVIATQMHALGRNPGFPLPAVFQKHLTGHPKGAAAAWMMNGLIQTLVSGIIPGHHNADNIDPALRATMPLLFIDRSSSIPRRLRSGYLHSFGFGQASAQIVLIAPEYLFAAITEPQRKEYSRLRSQRSARASQRLAAAICGTKPFLDVKEAAPYSDELAEQVYLDPSWRLPRSKNPIKEEDGSVDLVEGVKRIQTIRSTMQDVALETMKGTIPSAESLLGVGIDVHEVDAFEQKDDVFLQRNFTADELSYCRSAPCPAASLAGRWCAKEAVVKALCSFAKSSTSLAPSIGADASAALKDIEVIAASKSVAPSVRLHGKARDFAIEFGIDEVLLSISHCDRYACAHALARPSGSSTITESI